MSHQTAREVDVTRLGRFVATGQQDHEFPTSPGEIDAVPWTRIDTHLGHTGGHHPYIAGITCCEPLDAGLDPRPTLQIAKAIEPGGEDIGLEYPHL
jgi:hypothetical protein